MKKYLMIIMVFGFVGQIWAQISKDNLRNRLKDTHKEKDKKTEKISNDIYNPINFTNITERMPSENGKIYRYKWDSWSSLQYIKKGSNIHIDFEKDFIDGLGKECDIEILAYLQRKDKTI